MWSLWGVFVYKNKMYAQCQRVKADDDDDDDDDGDGDGDDDGGDDEAYKR